MDCPSEYRPLLNYLGPRSVRPASCTAFKSFKLGDLSGENKAEKAEGKAWPWMVWLLLKIIGLYNYRRIVTPRPCHLCHLAAVQRRVLLLEGTAGGSGEGQGDDPGPWCLYPGATMPVMKSPEAEEDDDDEQLTTRMDGNMNTVGEGGLPVYRAGGVCAVCRSEWWDDRGRYRPYSETDIGVRRWNHWGSEALSVIWPLTLIGLIMYDFCHYLRDYWGQEKQLIRLISYSTFLSFILSSPLMGLVASVQNMMADRRRSTRRRGFAWHECLGARYIVKRLQHLGLGERGLVYRPYLAVCLLWPVLNGLYRALIYYIFVVNKSANTHIQISLATGAVGMVVWGSFCYLVLLMRLSFQRQQRLELCFLWRHAGQVDLCRGRLALYAQDLGSLCRLVSAWVIMVVAVSTWAFTTQVCWDYLVISNDLQFHSASLELNINMMIWSENVMFLVLPLVALGGLDLNQTWAQFVRSVSQMRTDAQEVFWDKMLAFCEEQSPVYRVETLTLMFSALGLFLGLQFGDQNVEYWTKHQANSTAQVNIMPALH